MNVKSLFSTIRQEHEDDATRHWLYEAIRFALDNKSPMIVSYTVNTLFANVEELTLQMERQRPEDLEDLTWALIKILELPTVQTHMDAYAREYNQAYAHLTTLYMDLVEPLPLPETKKKKPSCETTCKPTSWASTLACWILMGACGALMSQMYMESRAPQRNLVSLFANYT